jgi:hypothetical protein
MHIENETQAGAHRVLINTTDGSLGLLKLKGSDVWVMSAYVGEDFTLADSEALFEDCAAGSEYSYDGELQRHLDTIAKIEEMLTEEPDPDTTSWTGDMGWLRAGVEVTYRGRAYEVVQLHEAAPQWPPDLVPALYRDRGAVVSEDTSVYTPPAPEYVQPAGAHDAYKQGDRVTFEGAVYECLIEGLGHSPAAYPAGWRKID